MAADHIKVGLSCHDNDLALSEFHLSAEELAKCRSEKHNSAKQIFDEHIGIHQPGGQSIFNSIHDLFNASSKGMKYHDWYHICCVIVSCYEGMKYALGKPMDSLSDEEGLDLRSVLFAAAFHDIGHAGVKDPDILNVSRSIVIAAEFIDQNGLCIGGTVGPCVSQRLVLDGIQVTQFPFVLEPKSESQKVLRDADLLQILEPTWFDDIYRHMYWEFCQGPRQITFSEFCKNENAFLHDAKFYSLWWQERKIDEFQAVAFRRAETVLDALSKQK